MQKAEYDFEISVECIYGDNSYWTPTPLNEIEELGVFGIIDIGDAQDDFEKLISLIHEIGHVIFHKKNKLKKDERLLLFEESLAWHLGYDYALKNDVEIDINEYARRVEIALQLYVKEMK
tara:strand:- start:659 stop:1018 length:360 start_codon:yes stop_codon:yes gene_type:complete